MRQFLGAYFHQDWDLDAPDAEGILDRFISDSPMKEELASLAVLVDTYAEAEPDDLVLEEAIATELWCNFRPSAAGMLAREWLRHVSTRLRAAAHD